MVTAGNGGSWNVEDEYPALGKVISAMKLRNGNKGGMFSNVSVSDFLSYAEQYSKKYI